MKDSDFSGLIDALSKPPAIGAGSVCERIKDYFVREENIRLSDMIEVSASYAGVSQGYVSAAIKEQIPLEDLFLAYDPKI